MRASEMVRTRERVGDHYEEALEKFQKSDNFRPNESLKEKIFRKFRNLFD